jgi:hypothetical protein
LETADRETPQRAFKAQTLEKVGARAGEELRVGQAQPLFLFGVQVEILVDALSTMEDSRRAIW